MHFVAPEQMSHEFGILAVTVKMKSKTGYLSAADWPLLPVSLNAGSHDVQCKHKQNITILIAT